MSSKLRHTAKCCILLLGGVGMLLLTSFNSNSGTGYKLKTIVIDAGHGGKDPGCSGVKFKEKDVALAVALKLGNYIQQNCKDVKVIYTRSTDVFVELQERAAIANRNNADLFICIHCNANPNKEAHGSETYVMGLHKTKGNLDVAKRENASILLEDNYKKNYGGFDPNSDEGYIMLNMMQNRHLAQGLDLAAKIQSQYKAKARRVDKGVKQAGFLVLWKTAMASLLTETGFLTNPEEEQFLGSDKGQDYLALSIFRAFRDYKDEMEGKKAKYDDAIDQTPPYQPSVDSAPAPAVAASKDTVVHVQSSAPFHPKTKPVPAPPDTAKPYFVIQLLSSDKQLPTNSNQFKGLDNIQQYIDHGVFKYVAGHCKSFDEAIQLQAEIRKKGFPDAFVIALQNGKRINTSEARKQVK